MLIAHLDFKGVLPRPEYLPQLLQNLSDLKYDGILVEYEDIFPFECADFSVDSSEKWSRETLQSFLAEAARLNLQVIPLQQTLGHFEYVLRWNSFRDFALGGEKTPPEYPSTIDITRQAPRNLALTMLREVLEAHPESRYVHLGMDEAQALVGHARQNGRDVVAVFLDYLQDLCDECERHNVKPVIWSDMLEDHFSPSSLARFKEFADRVVLCSWDYEANGQRTTWARFNGNRTARARRENPLHQDSPPISGAQLFVEDLDEAGRAFIEKHFDGETFAPLFWCDAWRDLGFEVWGASASRTSGDGAILPFYNERVANVQAWSEARKRTGASAQVVTSWARGTTFCPPIFPFDATWFTLQQAAVAEGRSTPAFFQGIDEETVSWIFQALGKCRENWRMENQLAIQMRELAPQLQTHQWEWEAVALLAGVLHWSRRLNFAHEEMTYFECNDLLPDSEWQRRIDEQAAISADGAALRGQVSTHFAQLYAGRAFQEWIRDVFDVPLEQVQRDTQSCYAKLENSRTRYQR